MKKLALVVTLALVAAGLLVVPAGAADRKDGKALFKEYCKGCHGPKAPAGEFTPMTLIGDQWVRFFDQKYEAAHKSVLDPAHDNKPVLEAIPPETLKEIRKWTIDHAADSEHPMTCG